MGMDIPQISKKFVDADGKIPKDKVIEVLRISGLTIYNMKIKKDQQSEVDQILGQLGDGPYTVEQVVEWHEKNSSNYNRGRHEAEKVIDNITVNGLVEGKNHKVHLDQLKHLMTHFCDKFTPEQYDAIIPKDSVEQSADGMAQVEDLLKQLRAVEVVPGY